MSSYLNSDDLIASVKRRASIPESQITFQDTDFLELANEEMAIGLVPSILQFHEEYFVYPEDVALTADTVSYAIPYRAIGNKLRQISYVDTNGNEFEMTRVNDEDAFLFNSSIAQTWPRRFRVEAGNIILLIHPVNNIGGSLRFRYFLRPNNLVVMSRGAEISAINTTTGVISFTDVVPDNFTTSVLYDFNRTKSDHRILNFDVIATAIGTSSITVDPDDIPDSLAIGDFVCQAGETVIPNVPTDLHVVLAHRVAARCLEALGDTQGLQNANAKLQEMEIKTGNLIDNRVEGSPQKVINRTSFLRSGLWKKWGR